MRGGGQMSKVLPAVTSNMTEQSQSVTTILGAEPHRNTCAIVWSE